MPDRDLRTGRIVLIVGAIGATVVAVVIAVFWLLDAQRMPFGGARFDRSYELTVPGPNLQTAPQTDLASYLSAKRRLLHELAWIDASKGIARIPIEDAIALIAAGTVKVQVEPKADAPVGAPLRAPADARAGTPSVAPPVGAPVPPPNAAPAPEPPQ